MKKIRRKLSVVLIAAVLLFGNDSLSMAGVSQKAGALKVQASISAQNVAVGKQISVHAKTKKVKYVSSNPKIASVTQSGTITGKKAGTVTIQVKRSGYQSASFSLEVTNSSRMPSLPVALDEVQLSGQKLAKNSSGKMIYSAVVQNRAAKGTVKKIVYYYTVKAAVSVTADSSSGSAVKKTEYQTKTVTLTAKNIKPKKSQQGFPVQAITQESFLR
ncbi:MAG: Ig-like domain-containing protein [Clostridiaceae bacterium]|nr:Ig-like domain-containing protein [Clostridiaceae bacterium]